MENKNLQFKTTLNCGGCVAKVKSDLDSAEGIIDWSVDTNNTDKILTVHSEGATEDEIIAIIKSKGFKAEPLGI
ncbi:heavy-metal-associated domain-containing protein [Flavobacterium sp.]|uniref:heavy-metal-associated domain-containing protein n=1 Tax=Flavobacterium sp. TaxID=239 RepID=UPI003D0E5E9A